MSKEESKVPELRFKGFHDDWEQRKFFTLLDSKEGIRRGPFGSALKKSFFVKDSNYVVYEQQNAIYNHFETRYNISEEKFNELSKFEVLPGDFIMSGAGTIGKISRVPKGIKQGVFNQALIRFRLNEASTDSKYFLHLIKSPKMQRKLTEYNPGSAMMNLVPMAEVKKWLLYTPSIEEQSYIGKFIDLVNKNITLHQRKINMLETQKKAYTSVIFANKSNNIPNLRFENFTEAWEQRKLGDVSDVIGGGTPNTNNPAYWDGDIDWYSPAELKKDIYLDNSQRKITELGLKNSSAKILPRGTVLFTSRAGIGNTAILDKESATNQGFQSIVPKDNLLDTYFIYSKSHLLKRYGEINGAGSTFIEVSGKEMSKMPLLLPTIKEQIQIGRLLKSIDNNIVLHQRKLCTLKKLKQVYLNKLFI